MNECAHHLSSRHVTMSTSWRLVAPQLSDSSLCAEVLLWAGPGRGLLPVHLFTPPLFSPQVHVKSENLAIKISQEINYAKSLYFEQQLMLPVGQNDESLLLEFWPCRLSTRPFFFFLKLFVFFFFAVHLFMSHNLVLEKTKYHVFE